MNKEELKEILKKHAAWLRDKSEGKRADLREANLIRANLSGAERSGSCFFLLAAMVRVDWAYC
jgi:hypothetical protein